MALPTSKGDGVHSCPNFDTNDQNNVLTGVVFSYVVHISSSGSFDLLTLEEAILEEVAKHVLKCKKQRYLFEMGKRLSENSYNVFQVYYLPDKASSIKTPCMPIQKGWTCLIITSTIIITSDQFSADKAQDLLLRSVEQSMTMGVFLSPVIPNLVNSQFLGPDPINPSNELGDLNTSNTSSPEAKTDDTLSIAALTSLAAAVSAFACFALYILMRRRHRRLDGSSVYDIQSTDDSTQVFEMERATSLDWQR